MSATMRALRLPSNSSLDRLHITSEATPKPGHGQALVRIRATSLNYHDYLVVAGFIPQPAGRIPMSDGAGEIVALGEDVNGLTVGDRVMGAFFPDWIDGDPTEPNTAAISGETVDGFAAEYVVVPAASLVIMPPGWSFEEAATLPCAGLTAWRALRVEGNLDRGACVMLPGSGGLSVFALQLAKAMGITAIVTSSSHGKLERLAALGADHLLNYRSTPDWGARVRELTGGRGADLVLEIGGQSSFAQSVTACRMGGRVMVVGSTMNPAPELPLRDVVMRHIRVNGMAVGNVAQLRALADFVAANGIRPVIDRTFAMDQLTQAFAYQLTGQHLGKIVVRA
ncbi:zinc-dependent alcohol dehydrogenase family protein [Blastomonas sp.]|uniref:zinc-dependent alcohol dehydrogenase family protein n=1 Tax=Blastomonas sp. TaxID=1909299 RepID=UPI00391B399B